MLSRDSWIGTHSTDKNLFVGDLHRLVAHSTEAMRLVQVNSVVYSFKKRCKFSLSGF
jgi:hypothetical protein